MFDRTAKTFPDGTRALAPVSLRVEPGELVAVVGPSGCGKSTLLRLAAGLDAPTGGSVTADRDSIGYVFQDPTLLPWRSVARNVGLLAELHGVSKSERRVAVAHAIKRVGLTGFERHYPAQLSGGMRMRTSLARSLTRTPRVFLFDEPFAAADEETRERLNDELLSVFAQDRFAGVFVTHSISEAVFLASRVVVMSPRPGRIVGEHIVGFGYPRPAELRYSAEFALIARAVADDLRRSTAGAKSDFGVVA